MSNSTFIFLWYGHKPVCRTVRRCEIALNVSRRSCSGGMQFTWRLFGRYAVYILAIREVCSLHPGYSGSMQFTWRLCSLSFPSRWSNTPMLPSCRSLTVSFTTSARHQFMIVINVSRPMMHNFNVWKMYEVMSKRTQLLLQNHQFLHRKLPFCF